MYCGFIMIQFNNYSYLLWLYSDTLQFIMALLWYTIVYYGFTVMHYSLVWLYYDTLWLLWHYNDLIMLLYDNNSHYIFTKDMSMVLLQSINTNATATILLCLLETMVTLGYNINMALDVTLIWFFCGIPLCYISGTHLLSRSTFFKYYRN